MASASLVVSLLLIAAFRSSDQCGPGSNFPTAKILETEAAGYVLMNVTEEDGVSWAISLKEDSSIQVGTPLYEWLNYAILINDTAIDGYHIFQLNYTLDLEFVYNNWGEKLSVLSYTVACHVTGNPDVNYEWFLEVQAVNEFAPEFVGAPFNLSLPEDTEVNTLVLRLRDKAIDSDVVTSSPSDIHEFNMEAHPLSSTRNMSDLFSMEDKQDGEVKVALILDFESFPEPDEAYVEYSITVWDLSRWNTTSNLTIYILDVDDQPPYFFYPGCGSAPCEVVYSCDVPSDFTGVVTTMAPADIMARDGDTLNYNVTYHISSATGLPTAPADFAQYLAIDSQTGELSILTLEGVSSEQLFVIIRAVEVSEKALSKDSTLIVRILYPEQTTTTSNATTEDLNTGFSTDKKSDSMVVAVVVLAIFVILALIGLIVLVMYMKKRADKPIYPANGLKGIEEEEDRGEDKREAGGSRTDSGQWSMSGMPSPGPHAGSSAPAHTRLTPGQSNGHLANGHAGGKHHKKTSLHGKLTPNTVTEESRSEITLAEVISEHDRQTAASIEDGSAEANVFPSTVFARPFSPNSPKAHAWVLGSGDVTGTGSDMLTEVEEGTMGNGGPLMLKAGRLPPLPVPPPPLANSASPKQHRTSRKQRKEQARARQREEVYDGTKIFPIAADDSFYKEGRKHKVKLSTRKKKHSGQLLSVVDDYTEV